MYQNSSIQVGKNSKNTKLLFILCISLVSCNNEKYGYKTIQEGGLTIKGKMTKDTIFDGEIKYYSGDTLVATRNFRQGLEFGKFINYYDNNKIKQVGTVKDGLNEGDVLIFDRQGNLFRKQYYYKGRLMGPQIDYDSNKVKTYSFLDFENNVLCRLEYCDTYTMLEKGNPFFNVFSELVVNDSTIIKIFCYIFRPPKFNCNYSIGRISGDRTETFHEIERINSGELFFEKSFPKFLDSNSHYCIKSEIFDSTSKHSRVYYGIY